MALASADASRLVARALSDPPSILQSARTLHLLSAGKAAGAMASAFAARTTAPITAGLVVGPPPRAAIAPPLEFQRGAHPVPDADSVAAGRRALALAADPGPDVFVVLLSGGASSMLAVPASGVTLEAKQEATRRLLQQGSDIQEINCVRKHLSEIKGGRLASASARPVLTLAISDVVGDDLSVIGSGPTVPDSSTYAEAIAVLERCGVGAFPPAVVTHLQQGARGNRPETPKPGDFDGAGHHAQAIGSAADALQGAREAATGLGYVVVVREAPVTGEARHAAAAYVAELAGVAAQHSRALCVLSAGETTVRVTGAGRGGRNQEFALAAALPLSRLGRPAALASIGTDGVDGPTDAAGAIADSTTVGRALSRGLDSVRYLDDNDAWTFFGSIGDLVRTGVTGTNVGDLQVTLIASPETLQGSEAL